MVSKSAPLDLKAGLLAKTVLPRLSGKTVSNRLFMVRTGDKLFTISDGKIKLALEKGVRTPILSEVNGIDFAGSIRLPVIPLARNLNTASMKEIFDQAINSPEKLLYSPDAFLASAAYDAINFRKCEAEELEESKIVAIADWLRRKVGDFTPQIAITLGSGLGLLGADIAEHISIPFSDIPFMPNLFQKVEGHSRNLKFGMLEGKKVVAMEGRLHPYEGLSLIQTVRLLRSLRILGAEINITTNATGAIPADFEVGQIVTHQGAFNLNGESVLRGPNIGAGPRFQPMETLNDPSLQELIKQESDKAGLILHENGFYVQLMGSEYENKGLINLLGNIGVTNIGMSSYHEIIAARHFGYKVLWYSFNSNLAAGKDPSGKALDHDEVTAACNAAAPKLKTMMSGVIRRTK